MQASANINNSSIPYGFGPLAVECKRRGIGRTLAYDLMNQGLIETFLIGRKRMVTIASLDSLPDKLKSPQTQRPAPRD